MKYPTYRSGAKTRSGLFSSAFTFIDLFAGIGGMRLGFESIGGRCIFTSEWNKFSQETYRANHYCADHAIAGDITKVPVDAIPPHDVLLAGFPCQPFSVVGIGKKKSLGAKHGFQDKVQGTLFFDVARIIAHHKPKAFLLENVKNLLHHDKGRTFKTILDVLEKDLGYHVQYRLLDAKGLVPQSRNRVYIIGFKEKTDFDFSAFEIMYPKQMPTLGDLLMPQSEVPEEFTLSDSGVASIRKKGKRNKSKGHGFTTTYVGPYDIAPTLVACYASSQSLYVKQRGKNPRLFTPRECARLMGFPDSFKIPVSKTQAWRQFGNTVVVPLIRQIASAISPFIVEKEIKSAYIRPNENYGENIYIPVRRPVVPWSDIPQSGGDAHI
jgi:DNA (cytosine-5)-methyltransferase 1